MVELPQQLQLHEFWPRSAIPILAPKYPVRPHKPGTSTYLNAVARIPQAADYSPQQQHEAGLHLRLRLRDGCAAHGGVRARVWWQTWASVGQLARRVHFAGGGIEVGTSWTNLDGRRVSHALSCLLAVGRVFAHPHRGFLLIY